MNALSNFFSLRPVFTYFGLRFVWYAYLLHMLLQLYSSLSEVSQLMAQRNINWLTWWPNYLPLLFGAIVQVVIVRLLFEVAGTVLLKDGPN
jgi:hypothetical protein